MRITLGNIQKESRKNIYDTRGYITKIPFVIRKGFEPLTDCLEGSCSIQLSYLTRLTSPI